MKIKTINRVVSDGQYGNVSASADLDENDNIDDCFKKLDARLRNSLNKINDQADFVAEKNTNIEESLSILKDAFKHVTKNRDDLPF